MADKKKKGSKNKVNALVQKLIKDNMYEPNEEESWLINEYDRFEANAKLFLGDFEKYYPAVWDDLRKCRRMPMVKFEEYLEYPHYLLIELLVYQFIKTTKKRKDLKSLFMLQKLQIVFIDDRIILN